MKKSKKSISLVIVLVTALIFLVLAGFWWSWATSSPEGEASASAQIFVIKKGEGLDSISRRLDAAGLVRSGLAFRLQVMTNNLTEKIQAGDFRLKATLSSKEVAELLTHGTLDEWLTFPEGWRREEYNRRLVANLASFDSGEFLNLSAGKEGYLFPDTYLMPKNVDEQQVVEMLAANFEKKFNQKLQEMAKANNLTRAEAVVMASIVEREAGSDADRPLIAGILIKRWHNDWPLQADATVQYAVADYQAKALEVPSLNDFDWWPTVTKKDLEINSPYNTYKNKGLPPGPICNPGLASIKAVVNWQESDYWFYLSDLAGAVHYARTNEEHNQNIRRFLR